MEISEITPTCLLAEAIPYYGLPEYASSENLVEALDTAMLCMVLLLSHEPEQMKSIIKTYERLHELRKVIQQKES